MDAESQVSAFPVFSVCIAILWIYASPSLNFSPQYSDRAHNIIAFAGHWAKPGPPSVKTPSPRMMTQWSPEV